MKAEIFDIVIVGAGLSGIGTACHLRQKCPDQRFVLLENRASLGGTWDLFRYPGIRSDSDMHTLGYEFKPWLKDKSIADGESILDYLREATQENGIEQHIRYRHRVRHAEWSSRDKLWTVTYTKEDGEDSNVARCRFLFMCSGYYDYEEGHNPAFKDQSSFRGEIVHPQFWPGNLSIEQKRFAVIGSGATAATLVPALAQSAAHVYMVQRSPSYYLSMPDRDPVANFLRKILPARKAYSLTRWKNTRFQQFLYRQTRVAPERMRKLLLWLTRKSLDADIDVEKHFTPSYAPWDQRLCLIPNGDLFDAVNAGRASMVTGKIDRFTPAGIRLDSGEEIATDVIVTATGLKLSLLGKIELTVDGESVHVPDRFAYKSMMLSDVPNMVLIFGYVNASWTLRADIVADFCCRLVNHMQENRFRQCTPLLDERAAAMQAHPWIEDFSSGYLKRSMHLLPRQGDRYPWINTQDYRLDRRQIRDRPVTDDTLEFST